MNLSALPELLLSWVKNQGAALLQGDKAPSSTFQAGQQYEGKVVDNLANGRHLVRVNSQLLDMNLPARTQAGDSVRLTYVNAGPRPTFLLNQAPIGSVQQVQISNTAQQVNALLRLAQTPASTPAATATASSVVATSTSSAATIATTAAASVKAATTLSTAPSPPAAARAAHVLGATSSTVVVGGRPSTIANVSATATSAPGVASVPTSTSSPAVAAASTSALSREATTVAKLSSNPLLNAQSATGAASARPIVANVALLQNFTAAVQSTTATLTGPNTGLLGQAVDAPRASIPASTTLSANTLVELPGQARHSLPVRLAQTLSESGMFYESHLAKWSKGALSLEAILREPQARVNVAAQVSAKLTELAGMPEEAARLAGRQLQILEGGPFFWQGIAWPGQNMQWLIREQAGGEGGGESDDTASEWVTELNLILPRMGEVHAQLGLTGERLHLRLLADEPATRAALEAALPLLAKGFEASGLNVVEIQVKAAHDTV